MGVYYVTQRGFLFDRTGGLGVLLWGVTCFQDEGLSLSVSDGV